MSSEHRCWETNDLTDTLVDEPQQGQTSASTLAQDWTSAVCLDEQRSPLATAAYFRCAVASWHRLETGNLDDKSRREIEQLHNASLCRLLENSRIHRQWLPEAGISLDDHGTSGLLPISTDGFAWSASDFQEIHAIGTYDSPSITRRHVRFGWGVPVVVLRRKQTGEPLAEEFLLQQSLFAATVVLEPNDTTIDSSNELGFVLRFINPRVSKSVMVQDQERPLASDLSAPFVLREVIAPQSREWLTNFLFPDTDATEGLFMLEPYQEGKIPVVFVHGLLSSPNTWVDLANDLMAMPEFYRDYQLWGFRYASGKSFLGSAALMRRDLENLKVIVESHFNDPALHQMVLVGHSMGGLISKAQVTESGSALWDSIANKPIEELKLTSQQQQKLQETFFFSPQRSIKKVIFIATPHQGSTWASRAPGWLGSELVRRDEVLRDEHRNLIQNNPGVFHHQVIRRPPDSIDLLRTNSRILQALNRLPFHDEVQVHTILGTGQYSIGDGIGDGFVGMRSAKHPASESTVSLRSKHSSIHRAPETVAEVWRILKEHKDAQKAISIIETPLDATMDSSTAASLVNEFQ